ncbi:MAG TPA: hypothetical protein VLC09_06480 [Polyangiaceae bacterium]|nr:hypothetical protein [Polyangiaceae bacterium]
MALVLGCGQLLLAGPTWAADTVPKGGAATTAAPPSAPAGPVSLTASKSDTRPWAQGVSIERQTRANEQVQQGNALLKESLFAQAAERYRASLRDWDHPGTHYNLALALLALDDPIGTHEHLEAAIAHGPEPLLGQDKFDYAKKYLTLLNQQLVSLEITCDEPAAVVRLDGKPLFRAPGRHLGLILRGEHTVTASKAGFETTEITRRFDANEPIVLPVRLYRPEELIIHERNYPLWIPITVASAGLLVAGAGGVFTYLSQSNYDQFDQVVVDDPGCAFGCMASDEAQAHLDQASLYQTLSFVGYAAGGALIATGFSLWLFDGSRERRVEPDERQTISVVPTAGPSSAGFLATGHF